MLGFGIVCSLVFEAWQLFNRSKVKEMEATKEPKAEDIGQYIMLLFGVVIYIITSIAMLFSSGIIQICGLVILGCTLITMGMNKTREDTKKLWYYIDSSICMAVLAVALLAVIGIL